MLNYLYYRFFRFFEFMENHLTPVGIRIPEYLATFAIVILLILNLITVDVFINSIYNVHLILSSLLMTSFFVFIILLSMYFLFLRNRRYSAIIEMYKSESARMKNLSIAATIIYIILTRCAFEKENKKVVHRTINIRIFN